MTFKTIVAVMPDEKSAERALAAATLIARMFDGHVIGVHAEPNAAAFATPIGFPDAGVLEASIEEAHERTLALKAAVEAKAAAEGLTFEWRSNETLIGDSALSAVSSAHCADLVIASQNELGYAAPADIEAIIFEGGRPVLLVPHSIPVPGKIRKVVIAWNGTREAARAAFDALPLLKGAANVEIFMVDPVNDDRQTASMAGAEIAAALARHGIMVSTESQLSNGLEAASIIENRVADTRADLLVMGAYSHSRLAERLFGGVTRTVLNSMPVLTLLSR